MKPGLGATRDGQPLSYNRAPAADLAGLVARLSVTRLELKSGRSLSCGLFADTAGFRFQLAGDFRIQTVNGMQHHGQGPLFFGPQSKLMPVHVDGDLISIGISFRPSAWPMLFDQPMTDFVDQVIVSQRWSYDYVFPRLDPQGSPEDWLQVMEDLLREERKRSTGADPNPVTARLEEIAFLDPAVSIAQAAREIGVDRRKLERLVVRDFGMSPKQMLKRARALDMASYLRGVADGDEGEALALRYYDESHLIREFVELFGMSPRQFAALPQPLLTLNLEIRQARRLEMIKRLAPGAKRPWE